MEAIRLYLEYKKELRFVFKNGTKQNIIRGSVLTLTAFLLVGLPTFIGYLIFLLRGQAKNADFLPPIEPDLIGDYTYIGLQYLGFLIVYTTVFSAVIWSTIQMPISQNIQAVIVIGVICLGIYVFPSTTYLFASMGNPVPTSVAVLKNWFDSITAYEYMTLVLFTLLGSVIILLLVTVAVIFVITLPLAFIGLWYLGVTYTRLVGHALQDSNLNQFD